MRIHSVAQRSRVFCAAILCLVVLGYGCGSSSSDGRLRVLSFNLDTVNGVFLNERLIFTFSAPVDPDSVNIQTIQIRYDASLLDIDGDCNPDNPANNNAVPEGDFVVDGNRVIFQPKIPTNTTNNDVGLFPSHKIDPDPDPNDCQRTEDLIVAYTVTIPGVSAATPDTVLSRSDKKPVVETYNAAFVTIVDDTFPPDISLDSFVDLAPGAPEFVELTAPLEDSVDNALDTSVEVRFTEAFLPSTVTTDSIFLVGVGPNSGVEVRIPTELRLDQLTGTITLFPLIDLPANSIIRAKWTEDLVDFGGNAIVIVEGFEFPSFSTTTAPTEGPFTVREEFNTNDNEDMAETSALWNDAGSPGQLFAGEGGGTAGLGDFMFDPDNPETMTIDTGVYDPANPLPAMDYSNFFLGENGIIEVVGENPLIIRSTTDLVLEGRIDVSGATASTVNFGAILGTAGGVGVAGGGAGGAGGSGEGDDGAAGEGARILTAGSNDRHPGGGGGSVARSCASGSETGGGGGGEYRSGSTNGRGDDGNPNGGGIKGTPYGAATLDPFTGNFAAGSGGGGAGGTCVNGVTYPGSGGGAGGGAVWLQCAGDMDISGDIDADGGDGGANDDFMGSEGGAAGAGGSGGAILVQGINSFINTTNADISANKGIGGEAGESGGTNDGGGGDGGFGRIRVEARTRDEITLRGGAYFPAPSQGDFALQGQTSVGTSAWFNTEALFPDYTYTQGGRNGGSGDQDNGNAFPNDAIQYWFQGAPPDPDDPTMPDLGNLAPGVGEFSTNIDDIDDFQFIRVKVVFTYPVPLNGITPFSNFYAFSYTFAGGATTTP